MVPRDVGAKSQRISGNNCKQLHLGKWKLDGLGEWVGCDVSLVGDRTAFLTFFSKGFITRMGNKHRSVASVRGGSGK